MIKVIGPPCISLRSLEDHNLECIKAYSPHSETKKTVGLYRSMTVIDLINQLSGADCQKRRTSSGKLNTEFHTL
ncbi:hypothetical protein WN55_07308 [Dufourea novaeangliae]|uniref:Uncharacterized protein n=1 Tax=Dufourea novaeangliae TaxID=178035 RepID=A0A154PRX7_DUFNO|nr:hypothetical protein WN55_07308 [Dufourea novaeangliae]